GIDRIFGTSTLWIITATFAVITLVGASSWREHVASSSPVAGLKPNPAPHGEKPQFSADQLATLYARPRGAIKLDGTEPVLGSSDAPVLIVEYADYGCPHCAQAAPVMKQLVHDFPSLQLRFKAFPLSGACNPALEGQEGVERCKAAMAAECAGKQGRYFDMSSKMFQNLGYNSDNDLAFMAQEVGLD
ncbi:MAG: thioredoxin domain-containing protein, partial [Myxococcales bacterium]|nr:thioredoxin domain-containing protein [Myxococcales bacterium]